MIRYHWELDVYKLSVEAGMDIFELAKKFPREEMFSLTDQIRRSSRSVSGQIAEGWRKRKYEASFVSKMNDAEGEAAETQSWLEYSVKCSYIPRAKGVVLHRTYDRIIGKLVKMGNNPQTFLLGKTDRTPAKPHSPTPSLPRSLTTPLPRSR